MQPRKSTASSRFGPFATRAFITLAALLLLFGIWVFTRGTAPEQDAPAAVGAAQAQATSKVTEVPPTEEDEPTPDVEIWLGTPNYPTPEPTYAVGPTAQFSELLSSEELETYVAPEGFSVKYPPDWYFETTAQEKRVKGSTTYLRSYDAHDPNLSLLDSAGQVPSNFIKVEISLGRPERSGFPVEDNEPIQDWVLRARPQPEEEVVSEEMIEVDGRPAFRRVTRREGQPGRSLTFLYFEPFVMTIAHTVQEPESFNERVIEQIVQSIQIEN